MGILRAAYGWWAGGRGAKRSPLPKIYHTYHAMMKLVTVILYLKKIQNIYESHDTHLKLC